MATYSSAHTGAQIDAFDSRIDTKISKAGDTMTGNLMIDQHQIDIKTQIPNDSSLPSSNLTSPALRFRSSDNSDLAIGYVQAYKYTDGKQGITIAGRQQINGSNVTNYAKLWVDNSGNGGVTLTHPTAWKEALDIDDLEDICLQYRGTNPTTTATDTLSTWQNLEPGIYYYNNYHTNNQPGKSGFLIHITAPNNEIFQVMFDQSFKTRFSIRGANASTTAMPAFRDMSMTPGDTTTSVSFTTNITAYSSSWQDFLTNWTAPANGYLKVTLDATTTPAAYLKDNTNGFEVRENGNGSRAIYIWIPCARGHKYSGGCVYCKTTGIAFYPAY